MGNYTEHEREIDQQITDAAGCGIPQTVDGWEIWEEPIFNSLIGECPVCRRLWEIETVDGRPVLPLCCMIQELDAAAGVG